MLKNKRLGYISRPCGFNQFVVDFHICYIGYFGVVRPILDAVLKQGVPRLFQHGLNQLGTPLFYKKKYSRAETILWVISNER